MIFYMHECEEKLGYSFKDKTLLRLCFTHSSYAHEHGGVKNNERLEYFGDSILGFITAEYLMNKFPKADEGLLTEYKQQLVSSEPLSRAIDKSGLGEFLMFGEGERRNSPEHHRSAMENLFEAIVAGIYLDGGLEESKKFIKKFLFNVIPLSIRQKQVKTEGVAVDHKGRLQDFVQKNKLGTLLYKVKERKGPDHEPTFTMAVTLDDKEIACAVGRKKSDAEKLAAQKALKILEKGKVKKKSANKGQNQKRRNAR
ncbi:MAG: ribonuclease III [Clostridia bacterium]|nr:ribonuclease III [Clostridia bacterium]